MPADHDVVVDFFSAGRRRRRTTPTRRRRAARAVLDGGRLPRGGSAGSSSRSRPRAGLGIGDVLALHLSPGGGRATARSASTAACIPMMGKRLHLWRLRNFDIERLPSVGGRLPLPRRRAREPEGRAPVRARRGARPDAGARRRRPRRAAARTSSACSSRRWRRSGSTRRTAPPERRLLLEPRPALRLAAARAHARRAAIDMVRQLAPATEGLGLEKVVVRARMPDPTSGVLRDTRAAGHEPRRARASRSRRTSRPTSRIRPLTEYAQKVVRLRRRGLVYPYEIVRMLTPPDGQPVGISRPASSSSTTSTPTAPRPGAAPAGRRTRPTSSSA